MDSNSKQTNVTTDASSIEEKMSNAQETYAQFYSKLVSFSNEIPTKMKSGAPRVLVANIGAVAEIIKPTDFIDLDANSVIKYVMLTLAITENFLQEVDTCQHVRSDNQSWFSNEKGALDFMITINRMSMASLRLSATDTVEEMSNAQETYAQFYSKLVSFSNEIPTKMKSGAPRVLVANIGAVAEIIKPTDFIDLDANSVIKYVMLTLAITENFLQEVDTCQHVRSDNQSWFSNEKGALDFMITINRMSMASLRLSATDTVEDVDHGIGGVNSGVYNGISSSVLKQIKELLVALAEGC